MTPAALWRHTSFRARLTSLVALAVGVAVALASLAVYFAVRHQLYSQVNPSLEAEASAAAPQLDRFFTEGPFPQDLETFLTRYQNSVLQLVTADGQTFGTISESQVPLPISKVQANMAFNPGDYRIDNVTYGGAPYRVLTEGVVVGGVPMALQVAQPLTDIVHSLSTLRLILWVVCLAGIAVAVALGWLVGRTVMRPVKRLSAAAAHVAATQDLNANIVDSDRDDELGELARSFNSMLKALRASRRQQTQLISDAGHELRTPLTSLRTNIEVLQRVSDLPEEDRESLLHDVNAQLEELTTLIGDVVELAHADEQQSEPIELRLDHIVAKAVERARRRAPSVTFTTDVTAGSVRGQPALLERAVLNVLDNAAKWSPPGGVVTVTLKRGEQWDLTVSDQGPGIPSEDLPHVFERFYRAPSARPMPGSGLGLAIVRQVVAAHKGSVDIACPPSGGTEVRIEFPIVVENEPEQPGTADWGAPASVPTTEDTEADRSAGVAAPGDSGTGGYAGNGGDAATEDSPYADLTRPGPPR